MISSQLRHCLRTHGFAKLAAEVRRERGETWIDPEALGGDFAQGLTHVVSVMAQKLAASRVNDDLVRAGLRSYARLETLR